MTISRLDISTRPLYTNAPVKVTPPLAETPNPMRLAHPRPARRRPRGALGRRLDRLARARGWTLDALADALGVSSSSASAYLRGVRPAPAAVRLLLDHLESPRR